MEITTELVAKLAHLSRLSFTPEEMESYKADLQDMISFVEKLQEVDTNGIEPLIHMGDAINALRDDTVEGCITRAEALLNAPSTDGVFFSVPKVIKKN